MSNVRERAFPRLHHEAAGDGHICLPSLNRIVPLDLSLLIDDVIASKSYMVSGSGAR